MEANLLEISTKRRSQKNSVDFHSGTNAVSESIFLTSIWNIGKQLGKFDYYSGLVVNKLKEATFFPIK